MDDYAAPEPCRAFAADDELTDREEGAKRENLFAIGEVAREFGFTLRALRFYEEKGLVKPMRVGSRRLYSAEDRRRIEIISQCKRVGLALDEIRSVLRAGDQAKGRTRQLEVALDVFLERVEDIKAEQESLRDSLQEANLVIKDIRERLARAN